MKNSLTKRQAVNLIRRAVSLGFKREVEAIWRNVTGGRCIMVSLSSPMTRLHSWVSLYFIFRRNPETNRWSIRASSRCDFDNKTERGAWNVAYSLTYFADAQKRHDGLFADSSLKSAQL